VNYEEALSYIHGTLKFGSKLGLHNIGALLGLMGNPEKKMKFVHVAGTNGKGSTVQYISSILVESGYKVGIYTSPYIQRFTERIRIGDREINEEDLARITGLVKGKVDIMLGKGENHPTEFEIVTAVAFQYYCESNCDIVVLEVGLGGRFDSTNIIGTPELAVITTISYDHMEWLGATLPEIAFEKAGIIKQGGDVITYGQTEEVEAVFQKACSERGAKLHKTDFSCLKLAEYCLDGQSFDFRAYRSLQISLIGSHQIKNAAVAIDAARLLIKKGWRITEQSLREGLRKTKWPGRLELISGNPAFLIDAAHNTEGAEVLRKALDEYFPGKRIVFIMGVSNDKDYRAMARIVLTRCTAVITVTPISLKALPAAKLAVVAENYCRNVLISGTIEEAVRISLELAAPDDLICAFGSLYYIGGVRDVFGLE